MDEQLVAILSDENFLPQEALRRAVADPDGIAMPVLHLVGRAADDPDALTDAEANLLFWGVHALAGSRDTRVFQPLLRMLRQDGEALEGLLGDAIDMTLSRVLASTFDGDAEALHRMILDSTVESYSRDAAFHALAFLTCEGRLEREATRRLLERFDDARVSVEDGHGWIGWEEAIAFLGLTALQPRVAAARKDGRLTDEVSDPIWFRRALRQVTSTPPDYGAFEPQCYGYLDDPVEALRWTAENYGQPVRNELKSVGRNDPCPCGSGKKYKKCCLATAEVKPVTAPLPGLR